MVEEEGGNDEQGPRERTAAVSLHGLTSITLGVPDVKASCGYYAEFGLAPSQHSADRTRHTFATVDGGEQLNIVAAPRRRLLEICIGADYPDDLDRIAANLIALDAEFNRTGEQLQVSDPNSALRVTVQVAPRIASSAPQQDPANAPGRPDRPNRRAPAVERSSRVRPRRLGHVVVG